MLREGLGLNRVWLHPFRAATTVLVGASAAVSALLLDGGVHRLFTGSPGSILLLLGPCPEAISFLTFNLLGFFLLCPLLVHLGHFLLLPVNRYSLLGFLSSRL